ncbi:hypothetical protein ANCCAN_01975 [Ancylostoma caninum]|uniref:Uncharacterized protein n=1 Tax=Ancylostoma caninum TaxID=29170 RepID=A0A368H9A1_ANCCA|nr:hypothetical protein ANCCAN_01975 [Ancylostoma caninum]
MRETFLVNTMNITQITVILLVSNISGSLSLILYLCSSRSKSNRLKGGNSSVEIGSSATDNARPSKKQRNTHSSRKHESNKSPKRHEKTNTSKKHKRIHTSKKRRTKEKHSRIAEKHSKKKRGKKRQKKPVRKPMKIKSRPSVSLPTAREHEKLQMIQARPAVIYYTDDGHDDTSQDAPSFDLMLIPPSDDLKPRGRREELTPSSLGSEAQKASSQAFDDSKASSQAFDDPKASSQAFDDPKASSLAFDEPKASSLASEAQKLPNQASEPQPPSLLTES